ncbi:Exosome complex component RRP41 [Kappamyces sp. JEL0829]|nr:Exosome complex component RRP41 [Kappamyces sp. JEL0829]
MSRVELISEEGLRIDGRRSTELRNFYGKTSSLFPLADGSCYLEIGNTKCICAVYGPKEPEKRSTALHDKAVLNVEFHVASFASLSSSRLKVDKRLLELAAIIKHALEPVVLLSSFPRSEIDIFIQVLQSDGVATSVGVGNDKVLVDLNYTEEATEAPTLTLAMMPKSGKLTTVQLECRLHLDRLEELLQVGKEACLTLAVDMEDAIRGLAE